MMAQRGQNLSLRLRELEAVADMGRRVRLAAGGRKGGAQRLLIRGLDAFGDIAIAIVVVVDLLHAIEVVLLPARLFVDAAEFIEEVFFFSSEYDDLLH